jgi:hypothetical protein
MPQSTFLLTYLNGFRLIPDLTEKNHKNKVPPYSLWGLNRKNSEQMRRNYFSVGKEQEIS